VSGFTCGWLAGLIRRKAAGDESSRIVTFVAAGEGVAFVGPERLQLMVITLIWVFHRRQGVA
jgi:hypothetical protein